MFTSFVKKLKYRWVEHILIFFNHKRSSLLPQPRSQDWSAWSERGCKKNWRRPSVRQGMWRTAFWHFIRHVLFPLKSGKSLPVFFSVWLGHPCGFSQSSSKRLASLILCSDFSSLMCDWSGDIIEMSGCLWPEYLLSGVSGWAWVVEMKVAGMGSKKYKRYVRHSCFPWAWMLAGCTTLPLIQFKKQ